MRELNKMELEVVSGGVCEGLSASECVNDIGKVLPREIGNLFSGFNDLGSQLGSWWYNFRNC